MFGRYRFSSSLALVLGVAITTLTGSALGQTVTMSASNPVVRDPARTSSSTDTTVALTITRGDCKDDTMPDNTSAEYTFNVNLTGYLKSYTLEAWAGPADCASQRGAIEANQQCWKLGTLDVTNNTASATYSAAKLLGVGSGKELAVLSTCNGAVESTARQSFNVVFMLVATSTLKGTAATQQLYYDMSGPAAPTGVSVGIAENALKVKWDAVDDEGEISYQFYCTEAASDCETSFGEIGGSGGDSGSGGTTTGGTTTAGGVGGTTTAGGVGGTTDTGGTTNGGTTSTGGTTSSGTTSSSTSISITGDKCGKVRGRANESGFTSRLANGKSYAVSVVAVDAYGNESAHSVPACGTPALVDTFFEHYRATGGSAGGSFCSFGYGRKTVYSAGLILLSLGAIASLRRRRAN